LFDLAARTLRPLRAGEAARDPFAPDRVAGQLGNDPETVGAILRRNPTAAEPIVVRLLGSPDLKTRRAAADLLAFVGTERVAPQVQAYATAADPDVARAVRAFLRRVNPTAFDAVAEAMMDLKTEDRTKRLAAMAALAAVPAVDPKRRNDVAVLLEAALLDAAKADAEGEAAAAALTVWHGDRTAARLAPALNNQDNLKNRPAVRDALVTALAATKDKIAVSVIMKWMPVEPTKVTQALVRMGPVAEDEAIRIMNVYFTDRTPDGVKARAGCVGVLAEIGTAKSIPALARASKDQRDVVTQEVARQAIETIKARPPAAVPAATPGPATKPTSRPAGAAARAA
ncbi:MAG: hypothetical protein JWO31_4078, partial [Phycisphaerales bacterium]|nr:hypothetical protein [Phycisphaerales bacterium]